MVPVPLTIRVCLLGLVEEVVPSRAHITLLNILFFYGRKAGVPDLVFWKGLVHSMIPFYKATYLFRGCRKKFEKVW